MLKYILTLLLLSTTAFCDKKIVFFEAKEDSGYVDNVKKIIDLSDDFIFSVDKKDARYIIDVDFDRLSVGSSIFDTQTREYKYIRTDLFPNGRLEEIYNKNTLAVLDEIDENHDMKWIGQHFYEIKDNTVLVANAFLLNNIREKEVGEPILEMEDFNNGKSIFIVTGDASKTSISKIDTRSGKILPVISEKGTFLSIADFDSKKERLLFTKIREGEMKYYELSIGKNQISELDLVDEEVVKTRYFENGLIVLSKGRVKRGVSNDLKKTEVERGVAVRREPILPNSNVVDFEVSGRSIVYKTNNRRLFSYDMDTGETSELGIENVEHFSIVRPGILLVELEGGIYLFKPSNQKRLLLKKRPK